MSNWVTLQNGVHIDLDDPNNPITGDGSFESYLGGGSKADKAVYKNNVGNQFKRLDNTKDGKVQIRWADGKINTMTEEKFKDFVSKYDYKTIDNFSDPHTGKQRSAKDFDRAVEDAFDRDLKLAFKEFGADEDAILDALRSTGKDYGMSNGDLQSVVESYVLRKGSSKSNDDGPSTFAMAKEMGMKASDLYGVTEKEIRERYRAFKKGK